MNMLDFDNYYEPSEYEMLIKETTDNTSKGILNDIKDKDTEEEVKLYENKGEYIVFGLVSFILSFIGLFVTGLPLGCCGFVFGVIALCQSEIESNKIGYNKFFGVIGIIISVVDIITILSLLSKI